MYTQNKATTLQTKILAVNTNYSHAIEIVEYEQKQLQKYLGQNILKIDGSFKAKVNHVKLVIEKKNVPAYGFTFWQDTHYWFTANYGKLSVNVKTCVSGGGYDKNGVNCNCQYENVCIDIFEIDKNGNLQPLTNTTAHNYLKVQYNEADILAKKAEIEKAAIEYEKKYNTMPYIFASITGVKRLTS